MVMGEEGGGEGGKEDGLLVNLEREEEEDERRIDLKSKKQFISKISKKKTLYISKERHCNDNLCGTGKYEIEKQFYGTYSIIIGVN